MATYSSTLSWKIPWMEEPDRLQSMGSQTVRLSDLTSLLLLLIFPSIRVFSSDSILVHHMAKVLELQLQQQ